MNRCNDRSTCANAHASIAHHAIAWYREVPWKLLCALTTLWTGLTATLLILALLPCGPLVGYLRRRSDRLAVAPDGACEFHSADARSRPQMVKEGR